METWNPAIDRDKVIEGNTKVHERMEAIAPAASALTMQEVRALHSRAAHVVQDESHA